MNRGQRRAQWLAQHRSRHSRASVAATDHETVSQTAVVTSSANLARASSVQVRIEELVLHGFPASSRYSISEATRQELARLLMERGVPQRMAQPGGTALIDAGRFQVAQGAKPHDVGALIANAVYGGS